MAGCQFGNPVANAIRGFRSHGSPSKSRNDPKTEPFLNPAGDRCAQTLVMVQLKKGDVS